MSTVTVKLSRPDPSQPWGFRIHGGIDFNQTLLILKVSAGSVSATQGLLPGDQIIQINGEDALRLRHGEALQKIQAGGNSVEFQMLRGDSANLERVLVNNCTDALPGRVGGQSSTKQSSSTCVKSSSCTSSVLSSSVVQQTSSSSSSVSTSGTATQPWKGPKFTEENIKEMMTSQASVLQTGAIGVNFIKEEAKKWDIEKSEVLKMLKEVEEEKKRKAQGLSANSVQAQTIQQFQSSSSSTTQAQEFQQRPVSSTFGLLMNRNYEAALQAQQPQASWITPQHSPAPTAEPVQ